MLDCSIDAENNIHEMFLVEFYSRTQRLPIKSTEGNDCVAVDMRSCSADFSMATEDFLENNFEHFRLLVTGEIYYVEVMSPRAMKGVLK
jgi:hypothetical protein